MAALLWAPGRAIGESDIPPPADTKPIYSPPPTQPEADRKEGSGAAIAAAAVGAAMAGASCAMLMKQAQQARVAGETQQAAMYQMMGMQQCAQMASNLANAAQNQDGKEKISQSDPGQPKWNDLPEGESKKGETKTAALTPPGTEPEKNGPSETVNPAEFKGIDESAFAAPPGTEPGGGNGGYGGSLNAGWKPLNPIDGTSVQFDDKSKGEGSTPQTPLGNSSSIVGYAGAPNGKAFQDHDEGPLQGQDGKAGKTARASRLQGGGPSGGAGDAPAASSSGSTFDLAGFMAQLGGKPAGEAAGPGLEFIQIEKKNPDGSSVTLFQYASFRYRKAQRDDGLLARPQKRIATAETSLTGASPKREPASTKAKAVVPSEKKDLSLKKTAVVSKR